MGKLTISMVIFNSYVEFPQGINHVADTQDKTTIHGRMVLAFARVGIEFKKYTMKLWWMNLVMTLKKVIMLRHTVMLRVCQFS